MSLWWAICNQACFTILYIGFLICSSFCCFCTGVAPADWQRHPCLPTFFEQQCFLQDVPAAHTGFLNRARGVPIQSLYQQAVRGNKRLVLTGVWHTLCTKQPPGSCFHLDQAFMMLYSHLYLQHICNNKAAAEHVTLYSIHAYISIDSICIIWSDWFQDIIYTSKFYSYKCCRSFPGGSSCPVVHPRPAAWPWGCSHSQAGMCRVCNSSCGQCSPGRACQGKGLGQLHHQLSGSRCASVTYLHPLASCCIMNMCHCQQHSMT